MEKRAKPWPADNGIYLAILSMIQVFPNGIVGSELAKMLDIQHKRILNYIDKLRELGMVNSHPRNGQNILYLNDLYVDKGVEYTLNALLTKLKEQSEVESNDKNQNS